MSTVTEALDQAETDHTVSENAMRWTPPRQPEKENGE